MIGEALHSPRRLPWGAFTFLVLSALFIAIAVGLREPGYAIFAVLPGTLGVMLLLRRVEEFHAELQESQLVVHSSNEIIPYTEIRKIWWAGGNLSDPLYIIHDRGVLQIPVIDGIPMPDLRSFIKNVMPSRQQPIVHETISAYLQMHTENFGNDRVQAYNAGEDFYPSDLGLARSIYTALAITAVIWVAAGVARNDPGWFGGAVMLGVVALVVLLVRTSTRGIERRVKNWRESSLVISPVGLALVQGDLKGELRWRELQEVTYRAGSSPTRRRISLKVAGAKIDIMDIYDTPLRDIHQRIDEFSRAQ